MTEIQVLVSKHSAKYRTPKTQISYIIETVIRSSNFILQPLIGIFIQIMYAEVTKSQFSPHTKTLRAMYYVLCTMEICISST